MKKKSDGRQLNKSSEWILSGWASTKQIPIAMLLLTDIYDLVAMNKFSIVYQLTTHAKITQFNIFCTIYHNVIRSHVPVNNLMLFLQINWSVNNLFKYKVKRVYFLSCEWIVLWTYSYFQLLILAYTFFRDINQGNFHPYISYKYQFYCSYNQTVVKL